MARLNGIGALLSRLVARHRVLRRQLVVESAASLVGAVAYLAADATSDGRTATASLAFIAALLAARDYRQLRRIRDEIVALARVMVPLV
jgi:hypothetical protein